MILRGIIQLNRTYMADFVLLIVAFIWGSTFVVVQNAISFLDPHSFNSIRFLMAALILGGWLLFFRRDELKRLNKKLFISGIILGFWLFIGYSFQTIGLLYTTSSKAGLLPIKRCVGTIAVFSVYENETGCKCGYRGCYGHHRTLLNDNDRLRGYQRWRCARFHLRHWFRHANSFYRKICCKFSHIVINCCTNQLRCRYLRYLCIYFRGLAKSGAAGNLVSSECFYCTDNYKFTRNGLRLFCTNIFSKVYFCHPYRFDFCNRTGFRGINRVFMGRRKDDKKRNDRIRFHSGRHDTGRTSYKREKSVSRKNPGTYKLKNRTEKNRQEGSDSFLIPFRFS